MVKKFLSVIMAVAIITSGTFTGACASSGMENIEMSREVKNVSETTALDTRTIYVTTDGTPITKEKKVAANIVVMDKSGGDSYEDSVKYDTIEESGTIKVRGNSTAAADKKPFNISFSKKQDVFGMGKAKKWSLLANAFDKSLIRNRLAMELATELGLDYTSQSTYVDLYINGEYYGNYLLIESVEVGSSRVDIDIENSNDILLEKEYDRQEEGQSYLRTARYGIRFAIGEPEGLDPETEHYKNTEVLLDKFERVLDDGDFEELKSFVDLESFVNFYIVNELFKNVDFSYSSTRFYIKDGKLYAGPLWDLDLSSGNASTTFYKNYYENGVSYKGFWCQEFQWFKKLMEIPGFYNLVSRRYKEIQPLISNMVNGNTGNSIDAIMKTYADSFARNYTSKSSGGAGWSVAQADSADRISYALEAKWKTHSEAVEFLRKWLINRNNYLKEQWAEEHKEINKSQVKVTVSESDDDIILNGNSDGTQSLIGSYSWNADYKWLGYVNFRGEVNSDYRYLILKYTGNISSLRFGFVANAGEMNEEHSKVYWFRNMGYDKYFVAADRKAIPIVGNDEMLIIDLSKSGIDIGKYNSGIHMHVGTSGHPKGEFTITDARFVKSVTIEGNLEEETTVTNPETTNRPEPAVTTAKEKSTKVSVVQTKIKKATLKKKNGRISIKLKKVKGAKRYQIQISKTKKFKKKLVKKVVKKRNVTFKNKKLKKQKKLYVRVRVVKIVNGKEYYSKWSKKRITIK